MRQVHHNPPSSDFSLRTSTRHATIGVDLGFDVRPLTLSLSMNPRNIQQPTSNTQHPKLARMAVVGCSRLDVGCWMFPSFGPSIEQRFMERVSVRAGEGTSTGSPSIHGPGGVILRPSAFGLRASALINLLLLATVLPLPARPAPAPRPPPPAAPLPAPAPRPPAPSPCRPVPPPHPAPPRLADPGGARSG